MDVSEQCRDQLPQVRSHVCLQQVGAKQSDATVDVEADAAGRDDAVAISVGGGDSTDGEAVAPVDVGHGHGAADDARQESHVGHLLDRLVPCDMREKAVVGVYAPGHPHAPLVLLGQLPGVFVKPLENLGPVHGRLHLRLNV